MPLRPSVPPAAVTAAAEQACLSSASTASALGGGHQFLESFAGGTPPSELAAPAPVYNLELIDLTGRKGLKAARRVGWRHLVIQGDAVIAATEVAEGPRKKVGAASYEESLHATNCPLALEAAELLAEVADHDFEVRMLRIPALSTMALWLHGTGQDLLIPLSGDEPDPGGAFPANDDGLQPNIRYAAGDYLSQLRPRARQLLAYDRLASTRRLYAKPANTRKTAPGGSSGRASDSKGTGKKSTGKKGSPRKVTPKKRGGKPLGPEPARKPTPTGSTSPRTGRSKLPSVGTKAGVPKTGAAKTGTAKTKVKRSFKAARKQPASPKPASTKTTKQVGATPPRSKPAGSKSTGPKQPRTTGRTGPRGPLKPSGGQPRKPRRS